jgi:uncharacterized repeat protein (TIGR03803 family)
MKLRVCFVALIGGFLFAMTPIAAPAQTFKTLLNFDGSNGSEPNYSQLVLGTDGELYGATFVGGATNHGTVFKITTAGTITTLYSFCTKTNCPDGDGPASLMQSSDGNFYGTTYYGGINNLGTIFRMTPKGALTTLHTFSGNDGAYPNVALVQATDGNFYSTTGGGGRNGTGDGTVFAMTQSGVLTTLYSFCSESNCADGRFPGGLIQARNQMLYGGTGDGGANGGGTFYRITPRGVLTTVYNFCSERNCTDGSLPYIGVQGSDGDFYGMTTLNGANNYGTVFRITSEGALTTLHSFNNSDGAQADTPLIQGADGKFYGTTGQGGNYGVGTVFQITSRGDLNTLHNFDGSDGSFPYAGLVQDTDGIFYGTALQGGTHNLGTIFTEAVRPRPFVAIRLTSGRVGAKVIIIGNNLLAATGVAFNGTEAKFEVVSKTEIKTIVPKGASTGFVTVTTPKMKLKSNVAFQVIK